ncbi:endonuclease [Bdellovibrio sp. 22V]|uniref:endonuclease I family protein n=1 Tax=Bdellovibrio TaxID=958 RepID=UPI0025432F0A|nr:endonuclease [Bdellovibrio sp. 22V]WII73933.1 endonuclease [Bdellovibrio sp. 22V]
MKTVASLFVLMFASLCSAAQVSQQIPYYGEQFYQDLSAGISDDELKTTIKKVLRSYHLKTNGGLDQIVNACSGSNCYSHISLGYDRARIFMMGVYYLIDHGGGEYGVFDVYCNKEKTTKDFPNGNGPGPRVIPDGNILNTEHTWPQSRFSGRFDKGMQKSDLHHLYPTDNHMNSVRGNNPFGEVVKDSKILDCRESRTGKAASGGAEVFEPPQNHKGNVARAIFYFSVRYDLPVDSRQEATLRKWNQEDPVDEEEVRRNDFIQEVQGNRNPFVDYPELIDSLGDF